MDCTNCKENCAFVKSGFIAKDSQCPNYVESWWLDENQNPKLISDCFPKRCTIQNNQSVMQSLALQSNIQNLRNEVLDLKNALHEILAKSKEFLEQTNNLDVQSKIKTIGHLK